MAAVVQYVFIPALMAGLLMGFGVLGLEDILHELWEALSETIFPMIPEDFRWQFALYGFLITILVLIAKVEPFLNALMYGLPAILSAVLAFIGGFLLSKVSVLGLILVFAGLFFAILAEQQSG